MMQATPVSARLWQIALALLYVAYYVWLLAAGNGAPYVMDGNETYSLLWHAHNLFHFGVGASLGLTDEAFSPNPAAHPFLYTHNGNFARLFAFLIYALGARGAVSQTVVTTAVVGTATLVFAYRYFERLAGARFSAIYCALLMTDYVLYAQWHVVTYRVWSGFFVFAILLCLHDVAGPHRRRAQLFLFLIGAMLFYGELVFAAMLSTAAALYAFAIYWRRPQLALGTLAILAAGGLLALTVLFAQLSARLGTDVVLEDLALTFNARNFSGDPAGRELVRLFFEQHRLAFWQNFVNGDAYRSLRDLIMSLTRYDLQVYTPVFCWVMGLLIAGWGSGVVGAGSAAGGGPVAIRLADASRPRSVGRRLADAGILVNLTVAVFLVCWPIVHGDSLFGLPPAAAGHVLLPAISAAAAALALVLAITRAATGSCWAASRIPPWTMLRLALLLIVAFAALLRQELLYDRGYEHGLSDIWMLPLAAPWTRAAARLVALAALAFAALQALGHPRAGIAGLAAESFARVGRFVLAGLGGYAVVYWLSPGIVLSGYQWRYAPFVVFFLCAVPAGVFSLLLAASGRALAAWREGNFYELACGLLAGLLLAAGIAYWTDVQASYARLLPPDHGAFFNKLSAPPFRGHSFVSNSYAAPLAASTDDWAYVDTAIGRGGITLTADGFAVHRDMRSYLWFADRDANAAYATPDFYGCFLQQSFLSATARERSERSGSPPAGGCSSFPLIARAGRPDAVLRNQLVARDAPERDYWAVLRLDFDYPPFVREIETELRPGAVGGRAVSYHADAAQQQGKPLLPPRAELVAVARDLSCNLASERVQVLAKSEDGSALPLPDGFTGTLAVRYTPRTATRDGYAVLSRPWRITETAAAPCPWPGIDHSFAKSDAPTTWTLDGWGDAEAWGTWTVGRTARFVPDIHTLPDGDVTMTVTGAAFLAAAHPLVNVTVHVNGAMLGRWLYVVGEPDRGRSVVIPRAVLQRQMPPEVRLDIAGPASPQQLGISSDERQLGVAVREVRLAEAAEKPPTLYRLGETLDFAAGGNAGPMLGVGWSDAAPQGTWSVGQDAEIRLALARPIVGDALMHLSGAPLLAAARPAATVEVLVNGRPVGSLEYHLGEAEEERAIRIPAAALEQTAPAAVSVTLRVPDAISPKALGLSDDPRPLGFLARRLRLEVAP